MTQSLSSQATLDANTLWRALRQLVERVFGTLDGDTVLDDCLDLVVEILGADRGLVLVTNGDGASRVVNARRQGASLSAIEREEISKTLVREAIESDKPVVWHSNPRHTGSVTALGILAALVVRLDAVPARASDAGERRAVLYVDFRDPRKFVEPAHVEFFLASALLVGAVLEQHRRGEETRAHLDEARVHTTEVRRTPLLEELLDTPSMGLLRDDVAAALVSDAPVLILGESGTGKTLLARALAEASGRRPVVRAMLGASDDLNTITSELFGHERGSFSGAAGKRIGLVEFAHKGTLILDEVLNLPTHAQRLLLDFTQFGTYRPLGYDRPEPKSAKVRIIAATNGDLRAATKDGRFREDLFHRLAGIVLDVPPLRMRREDIPSLAEACLWRLDPRRGWKLSLELRRLLLSSAIAWSGNVRQLEQVIVRARNRALTRDPEATTLAPEHLGARDLEGAATTISDASGAKGEDEPLGRAWQRVQSERDALNDREQQILRRGLIEAGGVVAHAARELGIARTTLASRLDALGIRTGKRDG